MNELYSDEEWRVIPGFNGAYEVSTYGRVLSHHFNGGRLMSPQRYRILKPFRSNKSTKTSLVGLSKNGIIKHFSVAKLVADAFLSNPTKSETVGYFDGNPENLYYKNLFWIEEEPMIKDSGERKEFETGAVRDIQEGKGRCDLLPLVTVEKMLLKEEIADYKILTYLENFKESGDADYLQDALVQLGSKRYVNIPDMFLEVSKHFEEGANKYGENNWQKGLPASCYINSAVRHYLKMLRGDTDERHDRALVWNLLCCLWTCDNKPELNDYAK